MRLSHTREALWALLLAKGAQANRCVAPPLNLPIKFFSDASRVLPHGVPVSIGIPPQQLVLTPSLQLDTSFIPRYTNSCIYALDTPIPANDTRWSNQDGRILCASVFGGGFVPGLSMTFHDNGTNDQINEAWFREIGFSDWHFVTERFLFADYVESYVQRNQVLPSKPNVTVSFILPDENATFGGLSSSALSLTPESRLLAALFEAEMVPSKSWSLTNETLCLGCVDNNAYTGEFRAFNLTARNLKDRPPCLLQVEVEALYHHSDVESVGVALIDEAFIACIDPGVRFLVFPADVNTRLFEALGEDTKVTRNLSTSLEGPPTNGSNFLTFKLAGGFEVNVTIPDVKRAGAKEINKWTLAEGNENLGAYGQGVPVLGKPFTDSIVLRWDEKAQEYGMAKKSSRADGKSDLNPLGCDDFPPISNSMDAAPDVGVIVGSIVGGFVAGLLFAAVGMFFYWRGQKGVKSRYEAMRGEDAMSLRTVDTGRQTLKSRISGASEPSAPSLRDLLQSRFSTRSGSPTIEPYLIDDGQVYEAPEGRTADPSNRDRNDTRAYSYDHR